MSGLTNDDFRRIVATPRVQDYEQATPAAKGVPAQRSGAGPRGGSSRPPRPSSKPESLLPAGYRDRAQERREREQAGMSDSLTAMDEVDGEDELAAVRAAAESLPDHLTKYLGGDQDRTHLVRGLDYLLLERSRQQILIDQEQRLEHAMSEVVDRNHKQDDHDAAADNDGARTATPAAALTFRTSMARHIYAACVDRIAGPARPGLQQQLGGRRPHHAIGTFQPGRTVYQFETDTFGSATVPTVLHRSEDDCGPALSLVDTGLPDPTRTRLRDAMACIREGRRPTTTITTTGSSRGGNVTATGAEPYRDPISTPLLPQQQQHDDDDDIFADVGDYVCEPRAADSAPVSAAGPVRFAPDAASADADLEPDIDPAAAAAGSVTVREAIAAARSTAGQVGVYEKNLPLGQDDQDDAVAASTSEKLRPLYDDYDEYTSGIMGGYDSDDDHPAGPTTTADSTTTMKKMTASKISKAKSREKQKLNSQWQQISTMIEKNKQQKKRSAADPDPGGGTGPKRARSYQ